MSKLIDNIYIANHFRKNHLFFDAIKPIAGEVKDKKSLLYFVNVYAPCSVFVAFFGRDGLTIPEACNILMLVEKVAKEKDVSLTETGLNVIEGKVSLFITCKINHSEEFLKDSDNVTLYNHDPDEVFEVKKSQLTEIESE